MTQRVVNYTYGTGNSVLPDGSIDVRDGIDNLQSMDVFMNAPEDTYNQRDGGIVRTVAGMNNEVDAHILNMGFTRIGTFATGATITNPRQTLLWDVAGGGDGQEYGWSGAFPKVVPASSNPASTGGISVGAWMSRFDPELRIQVRETLRRSYADAGYNLVAGSFEAGGVLANDNDALLQERTGKAFSGPAGAVATGTDPTSGGFIDVSLTPASFFPRGNNGVRRAVADALNDTMSVFGFMTEAQIESVQARDLVEDVTLAFQSGLNAALSVGARLRLPAGSYKITDTISLLNIFSSYSGGMEGESGNSTRIYFYNDVAFKNLFYMDSDVNYFTVSNLEFMDVNRRNSRGFYFYDTRASSAPAWKHIFMNVRFTGFKEGARFDGGATIGDDAHQSEVMFLHCKTRNCETGLVYNNTQAVNHQLIGFDMENDEEGVGDEWTHIKMERGSTINHLGGSVIGKGSYLKYRYTTAGGFQDTSQFASKGVRVEKRGGAAPIINHDTDSNITLSNSMRVIIDDMPVSASGGATLFARVGGRSFMKLSNVHSNAQMDVEAYMTSNLAGNGVYGSIKLESCDAINYKRISTVAAYGSSGVAATNYRSIPAEISKSGEGPVGGNDGSGYFTLNNPQQTVYPGGWTASQMKTLVYTNGDSGGFGGGVNPSTSLVKLPLFGRPCKFRLLRDGVNAGSAFVMELYAVVAGADYLVASITPAANVGGHFEANIQTPTGLTYFLNDGVVWDGKMKVVKSGTVNSFVGLIMIDYM